MIAPAALLDRLAAAGVEVRVDPPDRLRLVGPEDVLTPELVEEIRRHKAELMVMVDVLAGLEAYPPAERGRVVCRRLSERIARVAPPGLGRWGPAWDIVEAPSRAFLAALSRWEETGTADAAAAVRTAAERVVATWAEAARQWEAAGRPETWAAPAGRTGGD